MGKFLKIFSFIIILILCMFLYNNNAFKEMFCAIGLGSTVFTLSVFVYFGLDSIYNKFKK